jgi:hypothetical protein
MSSISDSLRAIANDWVALLGVPGGELQWRPGKVPGPHGGPAG